MSGGQDTIVTPIIAWEIKSPYGLDALGFIPQMVSASDSRGAQEQLDCGYRHGGGWMPFKGFMLDPDYSLRFPGDPVMRPLAIAKLRDEVICVYESAWVAVIQPDMSFSVARMD